ncbi:phage/plasmid primase, P4 family [Actinoplanes sp. CA-030573]|uniref:phage/plasmid primase, P4 family n=1 Tax=Actinoplanes sp. CA-030573 TaxID=3239898 RepID=UPI003D943407
MSTQPETLPAALAWYQAGCAVIPVRADGSKAPLVSWRRYQVERPDHDVVRRWFAGNPPGLAVVCGAVSGGLEMLELEGRAVTEGMGQRLAESVRAAGLDELWQRIAVDGYAERTPSGGVHLLYRLRGAPVGGNLKLARRPATEGELAVEPTEKIKTLIETRGEGGYTIVAPSHGTVHETGLAWMAMAGASPDRIPTISAEEHEALLAIARSLDALPPPAAPSRPGPRAAADGDVAPGDDYERRTDWADILGPAGWTLVYTSGRMRAWRRPGKRAGISATTGRADDRDRLFVFSTSTEFDVEVPITKFHAYTVLNHGGDHTAAASALRSAGFGGPPRGGDRSAGEQGAGWGVHSPQAAETETPGAVRPATETPAPVAAWGPTEDGLARALVAYHGHELRYCPHRGRWLLWTGHRWAWDEAEKHRELVRALARQLPSAGGWRRFRSHVLSASGVSGVTRLARSDPAINVALGDLDARPYELNTPGGIVDLRTGRVSACDPAHLHTRSTSVAADFDRRSEAFDAFLADTFGEDRELETYVQRLLGVSVLGTVLEQVLPFAVGPGANGKSTLLETVMHALGRGEAGYATAASSEMLMVRKHQEHPAELAQLAGARLVVLAELEDGQRFGEAKVKQLTGRDAISARFMRRDWFSFVPSHTLWLMGNHLPVARTGGPAFWRRIRVLPFTHVVPLERQNRRLGEILEQDAGAVLAWIIAGAAAYQRDGLREPSVVVSATQQYARDQDTVAQFVEELCELPAEEGDVRTDTAVVREAYERWCEQAGERPVSAKRLTQELRDRFRVGDGRGAKGRRFYRGIRLLAEGQG